MEYFFNSTLPVPQLTLSQTPAGNDTCRLASPIVFSCYVRGRLLTASLTHAEDDGSQYRYLVQFSNGYKAVFMRSPELVEWIEADTARSSVYAQSIGEDLFIIGGFDPYQPPFCLEVTSKGEKLKVWVKMERERYAVFFKGDFRFFLHNFTGRWTAQTVDLPKSYIVEEIKEAVISRLDQGGLN